MSLVPDGAADAAVAGATARTGYGVDGSGVTIGIISDSFNALSGYSSDVAAGYLPVGAAILADDAGGTDEGRAMAELIHETAPGAQIAFYAVDGGTGVDDEAQFAAAVQALQAAGAQIIVDDLSTMDEPTYQLGNALDDAVAAFIAAGGDYFTAAGNDGPDFYTGAFSAAATTLPGLGTVTAASFAPGVTADPLTLTPGAEEISIRLSWDQPYASIGAGGGSDDTLDLFLLNDRGQVVAKALGNTKDGDPYKLLDYDVPAGSDGHYSLVVTLANGAAPESFHLNVSDDVGTLGYAGGAGGDLYGHQLVPGVNNVGAVDVADTPSQGDETPTVEPYSEYGPGVLLYDAQGTPLPTPETTAGIAFAAPDGSATSVSRDFAPFYGTSAAAPVAAAVAALMLQANPDLTPSEITADLAASALPLNSPDQSGAGLVQAPGAVAAALEIACFTAGTRIDTPGGQRAVETLRPGDAVTLAEGGRATVRWLGKRHVDCRRHASPSAVWPVRIKAHAFGHGLPRADLTLSPDHAIFAQENLIPVKHLINGGSIRQLRCDEVAYFHIELPHHAVLPAESYLDTGDRQDFDSGVRHGSPVFGAARLDAPLVWDGVAAAPLCVSGPVLDRVRATLARRAQEMGLAPQAA